MGPIINTTVSTADFGRHESRFTSLKELRYYKERVIDAEFGYDGALPTLRAYLW
jgi:hypothetical protein